MLALALTEEYGRSAAVSRSDARSRLCPRPCVRLISPQDEGVLTGYDQEHKKMERVEMAGRAGGHKFIREKWHAVARIASFEWFLTPPPP